MTRSGTTDDLDAVATLDAESFGPRAWSRAVVLQALEADHVLVNDDGSGYVVVRVVGDVADLDRIAVAPDRRGTGLGRSLLAAAVGRARSLGATRMLLEVAADNDPAIGLYSAAGFVEINRRRGYYGRGVDAVVMELSALG